MRIAAFEKIFQSGAPDYAIGQQAVALARLAGGEPAGRFVNFVVRRLLPVLPESSEALAADPFVAGLPDDVRFSIPKPILEELAAGYGASAGAVAEALASASRPLDAPQYIENVGRGAVASRPGRRAGRCRSRCAGAATPTGPGKPRLGRAAS